MMIKSFNEDGYINVMNQYGAEKDNANAWRYAEVYQVPSYIITQHYISNGLFSKIIDMPAEEAVKHGFDVEIDNEKTKQYITDKIEDLCVDEKLSTGLKWTRLYGGAIGVLLINDGKDLEEELDLNCVNGLEDIRICEAPIVVPDYMSIYRGGYRRLGEPEYYTVNSVTGMFKVHASRCLVFRNTQMPEVTMTEELRFWGIPEYMKIKSAMRDTILAHEYSVKMLERSVQGVYKMKDLAALMATESGEEDILKRLQLIDKARGLINSIAIDSENESYDFVTFQLSGIKDAVDTQCNMLSSVTNIPQTLLFGRAPAGMNATGDSDFENYYGFVERMQKIILRSNVNLIVDVLLASAKNKGLLSENPKYKVTFNPLKSLTDNEKAAAEQAENATKQANLQAAVGLVEAQIISPDELRDSLIENGTVDFDSLFRGLSNGFPDEEEVDYPISPDTPISFISAPETPVRGIKEDTPISINLPSEETDAEVEGVSADTPIRLTNVEEAEKVNVNTQIKINGYTGAAIVIFNNNGDILVGDRTDGRGICGGGGHIETGETPRDAALRELQEEFGITPRNVVACGALNGLDAEYGIPYIFVGFYDGEVKEVCPKEMSNPRFESLYSLSEKDLFPPFKKSIEMFCNALGIAMPDGKKNSQLSQKNDEKPLTDADNYDIIYIDGKAYTFNVDELPEGYRWVTTKNGYKICLNDKDIPVAGNPYVTEAMIKTAIESKHYTWEEHDYDIGAHPYAAPFIRSHNNLLNHWEGGVSKNGKKITSHKNEYPGMTMEEYAQEALDLIRKPVGGNIQGYTVSGNDQEGYIVRYDAEKNNFVKANLKAGILTMFKPSAGIKYFEERQEDEGRIYGGKRKLSKNS